MNFTDDSGIAVSDAVKYCLDRTDEKTTREIDKQRKEHGFRLGVNSFRFSTYEDARTAIRLMHEVERDYDACKARDYFTWLEIKLCPSPTNVVFHKT